jgi:hypothetical protein
MRRYDFIAVLLGLAGFLAALGAAWLVFEAVPHLEDEIAYVWQAEVIARGKISVPSPPHEKSFLVPFVVDYEGERFGKYPLGWPAVLALGVLSGARLLVNPLLAGLGVWLTYILGKRVFSPPVGLLAAGLTIVSPFFLMNSGSLLSHPLGLVLSLGFVLAWLEGFGEREIAPRWSFSLLSALLLGALVITRPFTALGVVLPFALHGAYLFLFGERGEDHSGDASQYLCRNQRRKLRLHLLAVAGLTLALASLHFFWQYAVTGDPFLNPYTLWWDYDQVGFGPGHGHSEQGHTLHQAIINTRYSLRIGAQDLFGWDSSSWIFLPFGLWAARRSVPALLAGSIFPVLIVIYLAYWVGVDLFGPRHYYEWMFSLTIFSGAGIALLAGWPVLPRHGFRPRRENSEPEARNPNAWSRPRLATARLRAAMRLAQVNPARGLFQGLRSRIAALNPLRPWLVGGLVVLLTAYNLAFYTPSRLMDMQGLYGVTRSAQAPFLTARAQELTPALIFVHTDRWMPYGALLELQDPLLTTPFIFAWSRGTVRDAEVAEEFPDRSVYHYYPEDPYTFYKSPRP